jgi:sortase A
MPDTTQNTYTAQVGEVISEAAVAAEPATPPQGRNHPPLGPVRRAVRETGLALITLGVIVLLFVGYQLVGTNFTEEHNQSHLARQFATQVAQHQTTSPATPTDTEPAPPPGGAIDHLVIPKIGVDKFVVEGTTEDDLRKGPGHYAGTAYPGQVGNAAIAGHRTTYGAPFFRLNELATGDTIKITDLDDRTWVYTVSQPPQVVSPDDVAVLKPTPFAQLTLTTCNPRFSATSRLIVFARLVGPTMAAPPPKEVAPPELAGVDNLGHGTSGAWTPALLYGGLVVLLWVGVRIAINRTRKWYRLAAYVVGIGICLIPLWFCFENAVLLLPQSI